MKPILIALATTTLATQATPRAELLIKHLDKPTYLTAPTNSQDFLYVLEKDGLIRVFDRQSGKLLDSPFLDIQDKITIKMNEQGLLGMAFSPNYKNDKRFYLYYTNNKGDTVVSRYQSKSPTEASRDSEEILLTQKQDYRNHNGGWLDFGPDGMLYIGLGDGGSANDPKHRAQDLNTFLGKLLRIDVSPAKGYKVPNDNPFVKSDKALPEILSYGLRNPWRCSWHEGSLYIGDVGQNAWEEINVTPHKQLFSANFGWPQLEGTHKTKNKPAKTKNPGKLIAPAYEYKHDTKNTGGFSVTGGLVYKGSVTSLKGRYFFADYVKPHIWSASLKRGKLTDLRHHKADFSQNGKAIPQIASFAEDPQGEMYLISHQGKIYQVVE
ncbi:PQQ-dependent sugar dehydrogenase [Rubritalea tangerina]|uniref:PQQ-dependent sugar dehydrogenase n=1 Tax=Rubritalea tangerina TaxID=430798 RepID=A0ABW4Z848_9BACT